MGFTNWVSVCLSAKHCAVAQVVTELIALKTNLTEGDVSLSLTYSLENPEILSSLI